MQDVINATHGGRLPDNALLLTFDDGYIDNYTVAMPLLEKYSMQGSFFIPTKTFSTYTLLDVNKIHYILASGNTQEILNDVKERMKYYQNEYAYDDVEKLYCKYAKSGRYDDKNITFIKQMLQVVLPEKLRNIISSEIFKKYVGVEEEVLAHEIYMSAEQLRTMKRHGMFIGVHGHDHYWLTSLDKKSLKDDIDLALKVLDEFIDKNEWVICYPYGDCDKKVKQYVKESGAIIGLTTKVGIADLSKDDFLTLPRLDCNDFPPKSEKFKQYN